MKRRFAYLLGNTFATVTIVMIVTIVSLASWSSPASANVFWSGGDMEWPEGQWKGANKWELMQSPADPRMRPVTNPVRAGKQSLRVEIKPNEKARSSEQERAEFSHFLKADGSNYRPANGDTDFLAFSIMLDPSWVAPTDWGIIFQMHSGSGNPMFTIRASSKFQFTTNGGNTCSSSNIKVHELTDNAINKGKWVDFVYRIKWSTTTTGEIQVWRRNQGESSFKEVAFVKNVANLKSCTNDHYLKMGLYRNPMSSSSILYFDAVTLGKTRDEVVSKAWGATTSPSAPSPTPRPSATPTPTPLPSPSPSPSPSTQIQVTPTSGVFAAASGQLISPMKTLTEGTLTFIRSSTAEQGSATFNLNVQQAGKYALLGLVRAKGSGNNSVYTQVDNQARTIWHMKPSADFQWVRFGACDFAGETCSPTLLDLTSGAHKIIIGAREADTDISKLRLMRLDDQTPSIILSSTTERFEAESISPTAPMTLVNDSAASGGKYAKTQIANSGSLTYSLTVVQAGDYVLEGLVRAPDSGSNSVQVQLDGQSSVIWHMPENKEFTWVQLGECDYTGHSCQPLTMSLSTGTHKLTIKGRETDTQMDAFRLIRTDYAE